MDYRSIKELAADQHIKVTDLLALAPQNDPFYVGAPASLVQAQWFADLFTRFGFSSGVHLRRVHYQLVSQPDPQLPDGSPYENTEGCWNFLCNAGKYARILGMVSVEAFVDRRNPDPHVYASANHTEPSCQVYVNDYTVPEIDASLEDVSFSFPQPYIDGYWYSEADQPTHIEIWIEKSTMDDVLLPIGQELGVNVVTSLGFQSITSVVSMIRRICDSGKPARILYISDFDPAGSFMPTGVARQLEYWLQMFCPEADVALEPIALTKEQVQQYHLPRIPVKESDKRKTRFEQLYGEGAVELDALEALHPGELADIVRRAILPWRDGSLYGKMTDVRWDTERAVREEWEELTRDEAEELAELEREAAEITSRYTERLRNLRDSLAEDLAPTQRRLSELTERLREKAEDFQPELPERPEGECYGTDTYDWLYRSDRTYEEQIAAYRSRKGL